MYKQRIKIFLVVIAVVLLAMSARLAYLQLYKGEEFRRQAEESVQDVEILPAARGQILDRNGRILAMDEPCYNFCLDYRLLTANAEWVRLQKRRISRAEHVSLGEAEQIYQRRRAATWKLAEELSRAGGQTMSETVAKIIRRVENVRQLVGADIREERIAHAIVVGLDEKQRLAIESRMGELVGASIQPSHKRWYPFGDVACHVIGLTGEVSAEEMLKFNIPDGQADRLTRMMKNYLAGDVIGKSGVERMGEETLRGLRGYRRVRHSGGQVQVLEETPPQNGRDVHLTIDVELQKELAEMIRARGMTGSIIVVNVPNAEILAMVSVPTYNLNTYRRDYSSLAADHVNEPLAHRAVAGRYPPGSTAKPVAAMAGLAVGAITLDTTFDCQGYLNTPDAFRCWIWNRSHTGHGPLNVVGGIKNSCNVFFYHTGERVGAERLCDWFRLVGFADAPGTHLPDEVAGRVPTAEWVRRTQKRDFTPADARFMAIGQGFLEVTPMHVANEMATIARDGNFVTPMLALEGESGERRKLPIAPEYLQAVRQGMYEVVNEEGGSAYKVFHEEQPLDIEVCGKTGTAQTHPLWFDANRNGRMEAEEILRQGETAWFAGFAPRNNPRIAIAVMVEYVAEGGGPLNAAPIAREALRLWSQDKYAHLH
jgi:penicillin-binding protein 2